MRFQFVIRLGAKLLYSIKAAAVKFILETFEPQLDGFATSSLFETRLIRELFGTTEIHLTTPGIRPDDITDLRRLCNFISFNSPMQCARYGPLLESGPSLGVRVNTRISRVNDPRYDPCGPGSKLGIPIEKLNCILRTCAVSIDGLHIHTNADSHEFRHLLTNVQALVEVLPDGTRFKWMNLGGGYLFEDSQIEPLIEVANLVRDRFEAIVYLEPGAALVRSAGFLISSVLDIAEVDGQQLAILDTTVNHMPEVLEFGYQPGLWGETTDGRYEYTLVGSTCLAGDKFGYYKLQEPLAVGDLVVFEEAGAYAISKAHRFNGVNFPNVGVIAFDGRITKCKSFTYEDYKTYWTINA